MIRLKQDLIDITKTIIAILLDYTDYIFGMVSLSIILHGF